MHWPAAAQLAHVNYRIGLLIGNDPARPAWNPGNFFGEKFGPHQAPDRSDTQKQGDVR
jgi:hypothetical protein